MESGLLKAVGTPVEQTEGHGITLTKLALDRAKTLLEKEGGEGAEGLRVGVAGGGCSGMQYVIQLGKPGEKDKVFRQDGLTIFVDPKSYRYLRGLVIDYSQSLLYTGFTFNNPNASHSCGCGHSFTVPER